MEDFTPERASALLIGSWKFDRKNPTVPGQNTDEKSADPRAKVTKKKGIKKVTRKVGGKPKDSTEEEWAIGDLKIVREFLECKLRLNEGDVKECNYQERKDGVAGLGRYEILQNLEDFFKQNDKTHFILYYSGHANKHGSWSFSRAKVKHAKGPTEEPTAEGPSATTTTTEENVATPCQDSEASGRKEFPIVEVYDGSTRTPSPVSKTLRQPSSQPSEAVEIEPQVPISPPAPAIEASQVQETYASAVRVQPQDEDVINELVRYRDVIEQWEKSKKGRPQRYLTIIIDSCFSGQWVRKASGKEDESPGRGERYESERSLEENRKRRPEICIQAACRAEELSIVADNQCESVFTRAFFDAQDMSLLKKFANAVIDHIVVLQLKSLTMTNDFTPVSTEKPPFGGLKFFDSFDDMYLQT